MPATQSSEADSAVDHTAKGLHVGIQGLSLGPKPAAANEAAQTQTSSSRAPVPAAAVDPARPPSPSASVAHLANPFPHERAGIVSPEYRQMDGKRGTAAPLIMPGPRNSAPRTDDNDYQALPGCLSRTDTSTSMSTDTTGTPNTAAVRSCTWSSSVSADTGATSPTGDCGMMGEHTHYQLPRLPNNCQTNPQSYGTGAFDTSESGNVATKARALKARGDFGSTPKPEGSVHRAGMDEPNPLATRKTMPSNLELGGTFSGAPKRLVSHNTFPRTPLELTACTASVYSPHLLGLSPALGKGGVLGLEDLQIRSPPLTQFRMMEAGLSSGAEPEDRVMRFVQEQESRSRIVRDTTESKVAVEGDGTFSKHTVSPSATQPRTPERPKTSQAQGASTSTPESEDSPTAQLTPNTSDSDSDQSVDVGVMCEELSENSQDQFTRKIYAVIQQHTPGAVLDELDEPLKELANRCVERAANLAQASLNKRASAIVAAATFSGDSLPYSTESSPCDASSSSHPAGAGGGSGFPGKGQERANHRKRPNDSLDGYPDKGSSSQGDGSGKDGKRARMAGNSSKGKLLSCPYRTRNPLRFNVRDYESCATQGHEDMARLKRHIRNYHGPKEEKNMCGRCRLDFKTVEELDKHLTQDNWCNVVREDVANTDPEDGITKSMQERINGRKKESKVDSWEALWVLLFPGDTLVPSSDFVPVVESFEVWREFHFGDGVPPLKSRENNCQQYVKSKFERCIDGRHLSMIEAAGAPAGTAQPEYSGSRQRARPDSTPDTPCSSNGPFSSPTANRGSNGSSKRRCPHPPTNRDGVGSSGPPPSKHTETSNPASQSLSSYPLLAPRPEVTVRAEEAAASSTAQRVPSNPAATGSQSHGNGMGRNNTNRGPGFVSNGIASRGFPFSGNVTDDWRRDNGSPVGVGKTLSSVAAGKQPERILARRQSSSADTAIYDPGTAPPREREQQQVASFMHGMSPGDYNAETCRLLVSHTGGGAPDGSYNAAMCSASQAVAATTTAPDAMAAMISDGYSPFHLTAADYGEQYAPMDNTTAALASPAGGYMCAETGAACEGDLGLVGMPQLMPTSDQSGAYPHAQPQDGGMEGIFQQFWGETGTMPPGPHGEDQF